MLLSRVDIPSLQPSQRRNVPEVASTTSGIVFSSRSFTSLAVRAILPRKQVR